MSRLRIRAAGRRDRARVAALLRELSEESAYRRFQTGIGREPARTLVDALLPDELCGTALLGLRGDRWSRTACGCASAPPAPPR